MARMALTEFFDRMVASYLDADFDGVADAFLLPGAIYFGEDVIVLKDRSRLLSMMREHCSRNYQMGVRRLRVRVVAQSLSRSNNYSIWAEWEHYGGDGARLYVVPVRYVCRDDETGTPQIQLVDLLALPQCFSENEVLQLTEPSRRRV